MEYFRLINLKREPFSNSPDPDFFFQSAQHVGGLQKLELSLRLQRGLNVVIGEVGTGKTTLCRQLIRKFATDALFETFLILDPYFKSPEDALSELADLFGFRKNNSEDHFCRVRMLKERIKDHLFVKGVEEGKTVILLIDEGQKIPLFFVEILRELLNYETNQHKLLQIVIFAQTEFVPVLARYANFSDRINLFHRLGPLNFRDTICMIRFRLENAGCAGGISSFFSYPALWEIYRTTGGYPRRIIHLCHQALLMMVIQNKTRISRSVVRAVVKREIIHFNSDRKWLSNGLFLLTIAVLFFFFFPDFSVGRLDRSKPEPEKPAAVSIEEDDFVPLIRAGKVPEKTGVSFETPPTILGQASVNREETLGQLIRSVYGTYNPNLLKAVLEVNPNIHSPHRISIGDRISFPARKIEPASALLNRYRIEIDELRHLNAALAISKSHIEQKKIQIRILPHWHRDKGLVFSLILDEYLFNESHARDRSSVLQPFFDQPLRIVKGWAQDTVFFAALPGPDF